MTRPEGEGEAAKSDPATESEAKSESADKPAKPADGDDANAAVEDEPTATKPDDAKAAPRPDDAKAAPKPADAKRDDAKAAEAKPAPKPAPKPDDAKAAPTPTDAKPADVKPADAKPAAKADDATADDAKAASTPTGAKRDDAKPADAKPAAEADDATADDAKPASTPTGAKPADAKPAAEADDAKPAATPMDAKRDDAKPADAKATPKPAAKSDDTKPADTKPADAKPKDAEPAPTAADAKRDDAKPAAKPEDAKPAAKPEEAKPDDAMPAEAKPAKPAKPADAKPTQKPAPTPADLKPAPKPADAKPADTKPADSKPADTRPAYAKPEDAEPAPTPLSKASAKTSLAPQSTTGPVSLRGHGHTTGLGALCLTALGVVYGDIGTSPLYALRECFHGEHAVPPTAANVLGVLSMIFWALVLVVTLKYLAYVLRADNRGEGGELSLMALALGSVKNPWVSRGVVVLGIFGASLLYGDGMITPAISVLSAVEGLKVARPELEHFVVPITIGILVLFFLFQKRGTAKVGAVFGPVMIVWFTVLAIIGVSHIIHHPSVFEAIYPTHGARFMLENKGKGFLVLGAVFLVVTGGEALYADMGHFGIKPIRITWLAFVAPSLLLTYFGQGALLLEHPEMAENPFYKAAPTWALYPMLALATMATIIASQAVVSGAFSYTRQGMMLGFWPRIDIRHTSATHIGQIYVPFVNWALMAATIGLVLGFGSSSRLAAAYGIAVTTTMVITTLLAFVVAHYRWRWSLVAAGTLTVMLLVVDLSFFGANVIKVAQGGWFPLLVAAFVFLLMTTWKKGRDLLGNKFRTQMVPLSDFFELMLIERPARVPGVSVFMTSNTDGTPPSLMQNFLHNRVVHKHVILLTIITTEQPRVMPDERVRMEDLPDGFTRVVAKFGFMESPDIPRLLEECHLPDYYLEHTTFFLGRETVLATGREGMARWRESIFSFMARNSQRAPAFFNIPPDRVMEIGSQISI